MEALDDDASGRLQVAEVASTGEYDDYTELLAEFQS